MTIPSNESPWLAVGDFNALISSREKRGGQIIQKICPFFGDFMEPTKQHDLGFRGPSFTWHRGGVFEHLDGAIGNDEWTDSFRNWSVTHLPILKSNHRPLLVSLKPSFRLSKGRPFHFLAGWLEHPDFSKFFMEKWSFNGYFSDSFAHFMNQLKRNKNVWTYRDT